MKYTHPRPEFRSSRTFVANLLAFVLLASQLAPLASAQGARGGGARRQQPEKVKSEQPGKGERGGGGEKSSPVTAAPLGAPAITATKVDAFPDPNADGKADPGETITYTVQITNTGSDPATGVVFNDTVDANTTLVPGSANASPIVAADAYNVIGNVRIQPNAAQGLLANDRDPDTGTSAGLTVTSLAGDNTAPFAGTSAQGGQVTSSTTDGAFIYNPAPGFAGQDTFSYTVSDAGPDDIAGNADDTTDTATVTLQVGNGTATPGTNVIWFVDDSAAANGDGRLTSPFNCYTGANVPAVSTCFSNSTLDEAGDTIFLFDGAYTGGNALLNTQKLTGQGATATLATLAAVTVQPYSDPLPATSGNPDNVAITTTLPGTVAVPLAQGNLLRGFKVGATTGAKISGSGFGTLTAGDNVAPDLKLEGAGQALNLTNGTFAATSGFVSVATTSAPSAPGISLTTVGGTVSFGPTTVSGAGTQGINIAGSAVNATFGTTSVGSTTQGILIGTSTGNITFGATTVTGGTDGVSLQNNSAGTRTFGTITTTGGSGVGFLHSLGGGAVNVTGATSITNPAGVGIDVDGSNANLSFAATTVNKNATSGIGVDLTNNATRTIGFTSLTVTTTNGFALNTNNSGTVNAGGGSLTQNGAGGGAASLTNTTLGLSFTSVSSTGGGNGVVISGGTGSFTSGTTTLTNNAGAAILMSSSGVAANFGNTTVNGSAGAGVSLSNNTAAITFADLDVAPNANNIGISAASNTAAITSTSGTITTTDAPALSISSSLLAMTLTSVSADNTGDADPCVTLTSVTGTLTMQGGALVGGNAQAFFATAQNGSITYNGTISQANAFRLIEVTNKTGGAVNFGGALTATGANSTGIFLNANANTTFNFTGGMNLSTGANAAFTATAAAANGGGTVNITQNNTSIVNTLTTTTGTALNLTNTNIGASGLTFRSINSPTSSANNAVILNTTGTVAGTNGGLTITGNGGTCTSAATCTGGNIANKTGADASATQGTGIFLNSTRDVSLTNVFLNDFQNFAIYGTNVTNFTFTTSIVTGTNGTSSNPTNEGCVRFDGLLGSALITGSTIANTNAVTGATNALHVNNTSGTLTLLDIQNSTIANQNASNLPANSGQDAIFFGSPSGATGTMNLRLNNSQLTHARQFLLQVNIQGSQTANIEVTNNTFHNMHTALVNAGGGSNITGGGTNVYVKYLISGNSFRHPPGQSNGGRAMTIGHAAGSATFDGRFINNTIGQTGVPFSGAGNAADGLGIFASGNNGTNGTSKALIQGNTIQRYGEAGIIVNARQGSSTLDVTILGNIIREPGTAALGAFAAIWVNSGALAADTNIVNIVIGSATVAANKNTMTNADPSNATDVFLDKNTCAGCASQLRLYQNGSDAAGATIEDKVRDVLVDDNIGPLDLLAGFTNASAITLVAAGLPVQPTAPATITIIQETAAPPAVATAATGERSDITSRPFVSQPQPVAPAVTEMDAQPAFVAASAKPEKAATGKSGDKSDSLEKADQPVKRGINAVQSGETVSVNIGTLNPGDSVIITFQVTVNNPFPAGVTQVSNQGTVSGTNFANVLTDDPSVVGTSNPTVTPVQGPPDINIRDASTNEPAAGSKDMPFTATLSAPSTNSVTVNFTTADEPAGPGKAVAGVDYTATSGTVTFAPGQTVQTISVPVLSDADAAEPDETFLVNLTAPVNGNIVDGQAVGTITAANPAGTTLISELRTSGPGATGTGDAADEFVEIYNNTDANVTVATTDGSPGWGLFKMGAACNTTPVLIGTIPTGTVIPGRGHYLFVGSGYSLGAYAAGNQTLTADIEDDRNVGLFNTTNAANLATGTRKDAVGFDGNTGNNCDLLREGTNLAAASGSISQYTFVRNQTTGVPLDRNDNASDFLVLSTTPGTAVGATPTPRLGAPGPENLASPVNRSATIKASLADPLGPATGPQNRVRNLTPDPANNSTFGTLAIRRKFTNTTGGAVTRLRFRVIDITTTPVPPGTADLRVRTSSTSTISLTGGGTTQVQGLTLETPPAQPNGGGWNSTVAAGTITVGTPLAAGASINVEFLLGLQQTGTFRFFIIVEAVPGGPPFGPEKLAPDQKGGVGRDESKDTPRN